MAELQVAIDDANKHLKGTGELIQCWQDPILICRTEADCQSTNAHDGERQSENTDNDHKVGALQTLEQEVRSIQGEIVDIQALESIASLLKVSLKNGNSRVYTAGLACTLVLFGVADEQWHRLRSEGQGTSHLDVVFKNAVNTLAVPPGGLLTFLGDAKDSVRATARAALVQAAKTSVAISASDSRLSPDHLPLVILDKLIKEQGFASKNAKVREQVSKL